MLTNYTELLIRIGSYDNADQSYAVEAILSDGGFYFGGRLRLERDQLLRHALDTTAYGQYLFERLFAEPIDRAYDKAMGLAQAQTQGRLRTRLWIDHSAAELHAIRWERLYHQYNGQTIPLTTSSLTPFSRYIGLEMADSRPVSSSQLNLLIAVANPEKLPDSLLPIDVAAEIELLYHALGRINQSNQAIRVTVMPGRTGLSEPLRSKIVEAGWLIKQGPTSLETLMRHLDGQHLLHYVGHGSFRRRRRGMGQAALHMEDALGQWQVAKDDDLVERLAGLRPLPQLMFLVACETASRDENREHAFIGLAPKLVEAGLPSVIAMQDSVPVATARLLSYDFYRQFQQHGSIDTALNQARLLLLDKQNPAWDIPVLFMRSTNGQLLEPNPLRAALDKIYYHQDYYFFSPDSNQYLPLPVEVIHVTGQQPLPQPEPLNHEAAAKIDLMKATLAIFSQQQQAEEITPTLLVLAGDYGSNKTTQLRHIVWQTTAQALREENRYPVLPIYIDLTRFPTLRSRVGDPLSELILNSLADFWPKLNQAKLRAMFRAKHGPILRVVIDGNDELSERERLQAWQSLLDLIQQYPRHEYLLGCNLETLKPRYFESISLQILLMQQLDPRKIRHFLENQGRRDRSSLALLKYLDERQLFDLGAIPWFMTRMIKRARLGDYPDSRTEVLQQLVEDALAQIPTRQGMRGHAERFIYALALRMYPERATRWPIDDAFGLIIELRGNRGYNSERLYSELISCGLLAGVGETAVRFTYRPVQAYCAAQAMVAQTKRLAVLEDVTARFGRLIWLRWGAEPLVFVSGLLATHQADLTRLLQTIVYGVDLLTSEQTFLAARCILEAESEKRRLGIEASTADRELFDQVMNALVWRLDSQHEPRLSHRLRAAELLGQLVGQLTNSVAIDPLIQVATDKLRLDLQARLDYDFASMRMTVILDLQRIINHDSRNLFDIDPALRAVFQRWAQKDVEQLLTHFGDDDLTLKAVAAFALADLQAQFSSLSQRRAEADSILKQLITAFFDLETDEASLWVITQALALLDTTAITKSIILHMLQDPAFIESRHQAEVVQRDKCLAYLIGRIRSREKLARIFLINRCLKESSDVRLWATAIEALGLLADKRDKSLLETIAIGQTGEINATFSFLKPHQQYVQNKAITALSALGDLDTLAKLRQHRINWQPALRRAFYSTSEEIYWRLSLGDGGEL